MICDVVQKNMKQKLIISACLAVALIALLFASFLLGITHAASREVKGALAMNVALLSLIETGRTDRAVSMIETLMVGELNALESMEQSTLRYGRWYLFNVDDSSGDRWDSTRHFAETRVKEQRDEWNHLMSHPEEAVKRFEEAFEKALAESGKSNVNVKVTGGSKSSVKMELDGL